MTKKDSKTKQGAADKKSVSKKKPVAGKMARGTQTSKPKKNPENKKKQTAMAKKIAAIKPAASPASSKAKKTLVTKIAMISKKVAVKTIKIEAVDSSGKTVAKKGEAATATKDIPVVQGKGLRMRSQPVEVQEIDVRHARERKSRLDPFFPRSYGKTHKKPTVKTICDALSKHIGKVSTVPSNSLPETVVETGIFCIFAIGGTAPKIALDATKRSVEAFPNWNEFRISDAFEFLEFLEDLQIEDLYDRCEQVLEFVDEVYQDQNHVDLEYLREQSPEERLGALNRYQSLGPALAQYLALALQDFEGILFHYSWARVVQRVGIVPRSGSPKILMQSLGKVFKGEDLLSLQVNLIQVGEVICLRKNQQCKSCYLVMNCTHRKV